VGKAGIHPAVDTRLRRYDKKEGGSEELLRRDDSIGDHHYGANPNCIFCKIVAGEVPCFKLFEDSDTLAFMDINPVHDGHCLIIPKAHYPTVFEITPEPWQPSRAPPSGWRRQPMRRSSPTASTSFSRTGRARHSRSAISTSMCCRGGSVTGLDQLEADAGRHDAYPEIAERIRGFL